MTSVSVLQFISISSSGFGEQLVTHANSENRFFFFHSFPNVFYRNSTSIGITRSVGDEQSVIFYCIEIVVPRNTDNGNISF